MDIDTKLRTDSLAINAILEYGMKTRRHHNNKGNRQVRRGKTRIQVDYMARRLFKEFERQKKLMPNDLGSVDSCKVDR